jgi:hypothetical protein
MFTLLEFCKNGTSSSSAESRSERSDGPRDYEKRAPGQAVIGILFVKRGILAVFNRRFT